MSNQKKTLINKKSIIIHNDSLDILDELSDIEAGKLFKAIQKYTKNEVVKLDPVVKIAFTPFKNQFDRDKNKYIEKCKKNKENAKKRWNANASDGMRTDTTYADNDSKNDNKNDSKNKNKTKNKFIAPTYEEVLEYSITRNREDLSKKFFDYFNTSDWVDSKGNKVNNWKLKFITWENLNPKKELDKPIDEMSEKELWRIINE